MSRPPYFRPYGAQAFTRAVSASARISVPRFWRMYLALWLIRRWRLPATPCLILPVAVSLKRFFTPLLVLSLGIFVSLLHPRETLRGATLSNRHGMPSGRAIGFPTIWKARAYRGRCGLWQAYQGSSEPSRRRNLPVSPMVTRSIRARMSPTLSCEVISAPAPPMRVLTQPGLSRTQGTARDFASSARQVHAMFSAAFEVR